VYGSELTCVRFAPTGFPGGVWDDEDEDEEDPEHPTSASIHAASRETTTVLLQKTSNLVPIVRRPVRPYSAAIPAAVMAASPPTRARARCRRYER
jgi:hypothetical protein